MKYLPQLCGLEPNPEKKCDPNPHEHGPFAPKMKTDGDAEEKASDAKNDDGTKDVKNEKKDDHKDGAKDDIDIPDHPNKDYFDLAKLSSDDIKSINSLSKQINEHKLKLSEYKQNPEKYDSKDVLKEAKTEEIKRSIIDGRIRHIESEIKAFEGKINEIFNKVRVK
ncbi:hypothetical protein MIDIC_330035 [Alphaproteobacteria bacterium]